MSITTIDKRFGDCGPAALAWRLNRHAVRQLARQPNPIVFGLTNKYDSGSTEAS